MFALKVYLLEGSDNLYSEDGCKHRFDGSGYLLEFELASLSGYRHHDVESYDDGHTGFFRAVNAPVHDTDELMQEVPVAALGCSLNGFQSCANVHYQHDDPA